MAKKLDFKSNFDFESEEKSEVKEVEKAKSSSFGTEETKTEVKAEVKTFQESKDGNRNVKSFNGSSKAFQGKSLALLRKNRGKNGN